MHHVFDGDFLRNFKDRNGLRFDRHGVSKITIRLARFGALKFLMSRYP